MAASSSLCSRGQEGVPERGVTEAWCMPISLGLWISLCLSSCFLLHLGLCISQALWPHGLCLSISFCMGLGTWV